MKPTLQHPALRKRGINRRGRDSRASTMTSGRQYAVRVEGTTIFFECDRAGHAYQIDWSKKPLTKRMGPEGCKMMAGWWSREKGGCIGNCPKCDREAKKAQKAETAQPLLPPTPSTPKVER